MPKASLGAELGAPADPANPYSAARPEWYFLFLFQFLKLFEGHGASGEFLGAIVVPGMVMGFMFLMPFIGRWKLGHRLNIVYLLCAVLRHRLAYLFGLSRRPSGSMGRLEHLRAEYAEVQDVLRECNGDPQKIDRYFHGDAAKLADFDRKLATYEQVKKSADYLDAVKLADENARRAKELASRPELIPVVGRIELVEPRSADARPAIVRAALRQLPHALRSRRPAIARRPRSAWRVRRPRICSASPAAAG